MNKDLKPCPLCKSEAEWEYRDYNSIDGTGDDGTGYIRCSNCDIRYFGHNRDDAIEKWNKR